VVTTGCRVLCVVGLESEEPVALGLGYPQYDASHQASKDAFGADVFRHDGPGGSAIITQCAVSSSDPILPCDGGGCLVKSSVDSVSTRDSGPRIAAAPIRAVLELGAVAVLSCVIVGSASVLRSDKADGVAPTATKPAELPATKPAELPATSPAELQDEPKAGPWIRADPNPVPFAGEKGTTTITWDAADANDAKVYLRSDGKEELFSGGNQHSEAIDWIAPGGVYEFVLYADADRKKELAILKVTRPAQ